MYIGIDLGTSGVKVIALRAGHVMASHTVALSADAPRAGWSEQSPSDWWSATCTALGALSTEGLDLSDVSAVGLSGQMHGAVLLDAADQVLRPAILWNDNRATAECAQMERRAPDMGKTAGIRPLPGLTAPKLAWLKTHEPDVQSRVAHILLPKDFLGLCLHGEKVTDTSDAAGTLWLDQAARRWDPALCDASDTDVTWLPRLLHGHEIAGTVTTAAARATGLPPGTPVIAGAGDAAAGAIAMGATERGRGFISLGTSGQLFVSDTQYRPNPAQYVHAFAHTLPGRWYQMAAMLNGARPISWLAGQLGVSPAQVVALAASADPERVPLFLPYLTGERSPHGDPNIRGAFYGLEDATDRAALCRAVVEAIAFSFADAVESFDAAALEDVNLAAIGGGSQSDFVLTLIATATGRSIGRSSGSDLGPAMGAARLAACGIGELSLDALGQVPPVDVWFDPSDDTAQMMDRQEDFRRLYRVLRDFSKP